MAVDLVSFTIEAMVRGYHIYKDVWLATVGEQLPCQREIANVADPFAVAVIKSGAIVGHVPRRISSICSVFLRRNGSIMCRVTGSRRFSVDLVQGGLEIPCTLVFEGSSTLSAKAKALIEAALSDCTKEKDAPLTKKTIKKEEEDTPDPPPAKKTIKKEEEIKPDPPPKKKCLNPTNEEPQVWSKCGGITLFQKDKRGILKGNKLNDLIIDFTQQLLRKQFPNINGMQCTLYQSKRLSQQPKNELQILHARGDHWIVASTLLAPPGLVLIYDTVYAEIDGETRSVLAYFFKSKPCVMVNVPKQSGGKDCGVYSIAIMTALAYGQNPAEIKFKQDMLRPHLVHCLQSGSLTMFSVI